MVQRNGPNEYELLRAKRMQENNKKLQELGLDNAKDTFPAKKAATKRKPQLSASDQDAAERRRSSRVASLPEVNYEDKDTINFRGMRRGRPAEAKKKRATVASSAAMERACEAAESIDCTFPSLVKQMMPSHVADVPDAVRDKVFSAAKAVESSIRSGNPSLVRMMMPSHVSSCFWMGLPKGFCTAHMPGRDTDMTLVDSEGGQWQSRYLFHKTGLSGGWRGFALDHHLEHGDVAIFELIKPTTIKIEIVRVADYDSGAPRGNGKPSGRQQAKRKIGSRYENVPVQGRGGKKGKRDEESDMESEEEEDDEDDDEDEEEEEEEDDGEAGAVPSEDQSDSDESISTDRDSTDGSGSESDDAQSTDSAKKQAMRCAKLETSVESGSGCADEDHIEEPPHVNSAPRSRPKKKPPPAAARRTSSNVKSKGKECKPLVAVKPALAGGRPPKPQAVRNLSNVTKIRKISVDPRYLK